MELSGGSFLHYAHLALAAGGVDTFVIGTEMRGVDAGCAMPLDSYPFVVALVQLAADVKSDSWPNDERHVCRRLVGVFWPSTDRWLR